MNVRRLGVIALCGGTLTGGALFATASCSSSSTPDMGGGTDASSDATEGDSTTPTPTNDAGADTGPSGNDASPSDAGPSDAGPSDAGPSDTGTGAVACTLDGGGSGVVCGALGCIDTATDPANCGGCGGGGGSYSCEAGSVCMASHCQNVAGGLSGLRWELPCEDPHGSSCGTEVDGGVEEVLTTTLSGTAGTTYSVTLHFRGIVEQRTYDSIDGGPIPSGGAAGAEADGGLNPGYFVTGVQTPSTSDTFNIYELDISDPPQSYFLNSGTTGQNYVWPVDYIATIPMKGGATITMTANSVEGQEIANQGTDNNPVVVAGVSPYPSSFDGQFVQMDVTSVIAQ
jgi:hypothetical protein